MQFGILVTIVRRIDEVGFSEKTSSHDCDRDQCPFRRYRYDSPSIRRFNDIAGTFEPNKIDNSYRKFNAAGKNWLILSLELWARPQVIDWAKTVVANNPGHNVIVLTHSYLNGDGTISSSNGGYGATSPQYLYDNLVSKYANIKFVFSGHVNTSAVRTDTGGKRQQDHLDSHIVPRLEHKPNQISGD